MNSPRVVSDFDEDESPPPPPPPAPPAPAVPAAPEGSDLGYPWILNIRKAWVAPSKKYDDPNDLNLTVLQIIAAPEAKAAGVKRLQEMYAIKKYKEILDISLEWPLYFSQSFPCQDALTSANEFGIDYKGVYLIDNTKKPKNIIKTCVYQDMEILSVNPKQLNLKLNQVVHSIETSGFSVETKIRAVISELRKASKWAIATRDHEVNDWSLLPFKKGDIIELVEKEEDSGWFRGEIGERSGWFPKEAIEILFGKPTPKQAEQAKQRLTEKLSDPIPSESSFAVPLVAPPAPTEKDFAKEKEKESEPELERPETPPPPVPGKALPDISSTLRNMPKPAPIPIPMEPEEFPNLTRKDSGEVPDNSTDVVLANPDEAQNYTIFEYAKNYYRVEVKKESAGTSEEEGGLSRGSMRGTLKKLRGSTNKRKKEDEWSELINKIKYSKEPIKQSLHKNLEPNESKLAVDIFLAVMSYMGDYPSKNAQAQLVQHLVAAGLKKEILRDEIYCQILKQLTGNKSTKKDSAKKGWDLLIVCSSCFPPTEVFSPYLVHSLNQYSSNPEIGAKAAEALKRIGRVKKLGVRKLPPGAPEIMSIETGTPMSMRVHFPGEASRMLIIDSNTTAEEVLQKVAQKIQLKDASSFGLYVQITNGGTTPIANSDYVLDILNIAERMVASMPQPKKKDLTPTPGYLVICKKKLWTPQKKEAEADMIIVMNYHQLLPDFMSGNVFSNKEIHGSFTPKAIELIALMLKADSAFDQTLLNNADYLKSVVPEILYGGQDPNYWRSQIAQAYLKITGTNELQHKRKFIEILKTFSFFGSGFFDIKSSSDPKFPNGGLLVVNFKEISLIDRKTRMVLMLTNYDTIVNFRFDDGEFVMKTGDLMTKNMVSFQTSQGFEIADLIQCYILLRMNEAKSSTSKKYNAF